LDALPKMNGLLRVDLVQTKATDAGVERLLLEYPGLDMVTLSDNPHITEKVLATVGALKSLQHLQLQWMTLTDRGLQTLAGLKKLRALGLIETSATPEQIATLKEALPKCNLEIVLKSGDGTASP
jgi:hypothetical protein